MSYAPYAHSDDNCDFANTHICPGASVCGGAERAEREAAAKGVPVRTGAYLRLEQLCSVQECDLLGDHATFCPTLYDPYDAWARAAGA